MAYSVCQTFWWIQFLMNGIEEAFFKKKAKKDYRQIKTATFIVNVKESNQACLF